jgi:hypothetical protein
MEQKKIQQILVNIEELRNRLMGLPHGPGEPPPWDELLTYLSALEQYMKAAARSEETLRNLSMAKPFWEETYSLLEDLSRMPKIVQAQPFRGPGVDFYQQQRVRIDKIFYLLKGATTFEWPQPADWGGPRGPGQPPDEAGPAAFGPRGPGGDPDDKA